MRLVSFRLATPLGLHTRLGALGPDEQVVDLQAACRSQLLGEGLTQAAAERLSAALLPADMTAFIEGGERSLTAARAALAHALAVGISFPDRSQLTWLPPVPHPPMLRDFMAFEAHLQNIYPRLGREIPAEWYNLPVYYKGNTGSLAADGEAVPIPGYASELDFEFEFAAVIGKGGADIPGERAMEHIFGYMIYNDFSARAIQAREMTVGLGPAKGKDFRCGHAFGPCLVTADEIPNVYDLAMQARVNGAVWTEGNSGSMHWRFADMIAHASQSEELRPGEIFGSGTVGNGSGAERGVGLQRGDVVELRVTGLGVLTNRIV